MPPRQPTVCQVVTPRKRIPSTSLRFQEPFRQGEILCDVAQKKWKIGRCIGVGAFGEIYLASDDISKPVWNDAKYVIKVEPHRNGPLFVEMNFYLRVFKEELIEEWKKTKHLKHLGMPSFHGFGSHYHKGERYRFIVLPKLGEDIDKLFLKHSKRFHIKTALTLAAHVLDTLEYIHSRGYIHSDIKGMNMVLGNGAENPASVYLLDFGLACRYSYIDGIHKEYNPDGRKAEAGTLEFSSRDAHIGAVSRRSDLESLGYNLIRWLDGRLPWERDLSNADLVAELKEKSMKNVRSFLASSFPSNLKPPEALEKFLTYTASLEFNQKPDYAYCKRVFNEGIRSAGFLDDSKLTFDQHAKLPAKSRKRRPEDENIISPKYKKMKKQVPKGDRRPCSIFNHTARVTRNLDRGVRLRSRDFDWAMILASHPEKPENKTNKTKRKTSRAQTPVESPVDKSETVFYQGRNCDFSNPTPAMLKVMEMKKKRGSSESLRRSRNDSMIFSNLTPAMEEVLAKKQASKMSFRRTLRSASRNGTRQGF